MSAQLVANIQVHSQGLRSLDPRRDLHQVADLIEHAFRGELEPGGLAALRDMRMLARMGPLVSLIARSDPNLEEMLGGFVWIEDGRVVGNVTIQRIDPYGDRWQIANVAVASDHQGRGIGRALVTAAVEHIGERGGTWAVLQVREDNAVARGLYERLGFEPLTQDVTLKLARIEKIQPTNLVSGLRSYRRAEWHARYELETAARTSLAQWWRPVHSRDFWQSAESYLGERLWEMFGRNRIRRWVVPGNQQLAAWLALDAWRWRGVHQLHFTVHPSCRGQMEDQLVSFALAFLADYPHWPAEVRHQGEHREMIETLLRHGFQIVRNHLAMRKKLTP